MKKLINTSVVIKKVPEIIKLLICPLLTILVMVFLLFLVRVTTTSSTIFKK